MKYFFNIVIFLLIAKANPQSTFEEEVLKPIQSSTVLIEKVFVHTNKTAYFPEDTVWFKAYVGNAENKPSKETKKLYVNILDINGELILNKTLYIHDGVGNGEFELKDKIAPGSYFIQAYTNNMRNFGDDYCYLQQIEIIGNPALKVKKQENIFNVQITPESYFVENIEALIGIKVFHNGKPVHFSGQLLNSNTDPVQEFTEQHDGITSCHFVYKENETYTALIKLKDTVLKKKIPIANKKGIAVHLNNTNKDTLKVELNTNKKTRNNKGSYALLFHQQRHINDYLKFSQLDSTKAMIKLDKATLNPGVNMVTLFKDNRPIAERKFFVENIHKKVNTTIQKVASTQDSITYKLSLKSGTQPIRANLSISVISENHKNYIENQTIESAFLLTPFLDEPLENPAYYFNKDNSNRKVGLDVLLNTQGLSHTSAERMIASLNPKPVYEFEKGFRLQGTIKGIFRSNKLALLSNENRIIDYQFLNGNKHFEFKDILFYKNDTIKFSFLEYQNIPLKPEGITIKSAQEKSIPKSKLSLFYHKNKKDVESEVESWYAKGKNTLDEVVVTSKKRSESFLRNKRLMKKYQPMVWDIGKYYEVPLPDTFKSWNNDLMSFLRSDQNVRLIQTDRGEYYLEVNNKKEAGLFVDGKRIKSAQLATLNIKMENIAHIMLQPLGRGNRLYQVFTKDNSKNNYSPLYKKYLVENGYDRPKNYYPPFYTFTSGKPQWQEIDWKPNVVTNYKGEAVIKISKKAKQKKVFFSIQGFSEKGFLISEKLIK